MTLQRVVIEITGSPKELDSTIHKLEALGKVDKQNADQYRKSHQEFKNQTKEKENEVERLSDGIKNKMERIGEYIVAAFAFEKIAQFSKEAIKKAEEMQTAYNQL